MYPSFMQFFNLYLRLLPLFSVSGAWFAYIGGASLVLGALAGATALLLVLLPGRLVQSRGSVRKNRASDGF